MNTSNQSTQRKRNIKCWAYVVAGVIVQTIIIVLFLVLVMRIRNPKVRLAGVTVENLKASSSSRSFTMKLNALVTIKNTNFGHFKFKNATLTISYKGTPVGEATIVKARAGARSTKKFNVTISVSSNRKVSRDSLGSDIDSGIISLDSHAKLEGKIHLFKVIKKKKSAEMSCTIDVNTTLKQIRNLGCNQNFN